MTYKTIHSQTIAGTVIELEQQLRPCRETLFAVQYGFQRTEGLTYPNAAKEYGACVMHALACEGVLIDES